MRFRSTRGGSPLLGFSEALTQSLAPDGGLYVPERFPVLSAEELLSIPSGTLADTALWALAPFFEGDALQSELGMIAREALNFSVPLVPLSDDTSVLELFHGPTAAFKDVGARFLAACLARIPGGERTVLVATSGDTGGAVAAAFHGREGFRVFILYPEGKVSPRQEAQLTAWGGNVRALRVRGDFDDCQRVVKAAFADRALVAAHGLVAANSISVGRLLPQMAYYARASLEHQRERGDVTGFVIPSGNLGNAVACFWARELGFPVGEIVLATNANRAVPDFFASGAWSPAPTIATLANAMDVGNPSNLERLRDLFPDIEDLRAGARSRSVSDVEIREEIRAGMKEFHRAWCPHTAAAAWARRQLSEGHWTIVSTAHPAKFESIVEPLVGAPVEVPPPLAAILKRPTQFEDMTPDLASLTRLL